MVSESGSKRGVKKSKQVFGDVQIQELLKTLKGLGSRDDGDAFLRQNAMTRENLEKLARLMQLPMQREDNNDRLRMKIVESAIGSRLRSDAIQGEGRWKD